MCFGVLGFGKDIRFLQPVSVCGRVGMFGLRMGAGSALMRDMIS